MAKHNLHHLLSLFQEFELEFQNLESLVFQLYVKTAFLKDAWREIVVVQRNLDA